MSGISGGWPRDLTDKQDRMYAEQIERIRAEETRAADATIELAGALARSLARAKRTGRRPKVKAVPARADRQDGDT
jgi:hypothetical protein